MALNFKPQSLHDFNREPILNGNPKVYINNNITGGQDGDKDIVSVSSAGEILVIEIRNVNGNKYISNQYPDNDYDLAPLGF